ncbi:MAG: exodeoxyribonuclease III [Treponema sp.]|nr:exodeoxyribonuclease III [Treponema sp.]MBS7241866.1 exodeoxyribonuclease III [Treponema sp.]MCI6443048.1 exodeoxyribonuclease III [Spirochaetia bacterium]MDY4132671.1 exodeoxyribonuclease III [Treponema sp.]
MMKIITWNVNGIRAVEKKDFCSWLANCGADVVCIQETKAKPEQLSENLTAPAGYKAYWASAVKAGYSGTAIYSKSEPDKVEVLGDDRFDSEGRVLMAYFGKLVVISAYFPNSQDKGARLDYKLAFCDAVLKKLDGLVADGYDIVLCGDYNIAHKAIDLANPKTNEGNAGYLPEERAWMDKFTTSGYVDTFRHFCQEPKMYSWWSYRFHAREKNVGWRIDYANVNERLLPKVKSCVINSDVMGSDHCPVTLELE